jgi:hypothetical protein
MKNPKARMWFVLVVNSVLIGLALFFSAGTTNYWQAWVYLGVGTVSSALLTLAVMKDPVLLESRTRFGPTAETRTIQRSSCCARGSQPSLRSSFPGLIAVSAGRTCLPGFP